MAWLRPLLRYLGILLLGSLLLVLTALGWTLATESGSRWLIHRGLAWVPGTLQIEEVSGRLIDNLRLRGIRYREGALSLQTASLALDWQPMRLLSGELLIERLELGDTDLHLPPSAPQAEEQQPTAIAWPEQVVLPLALELRLLRLHRLTLHPPAGAEPEPAPEKEPEKELQQLEGARLSLSARDGRVELRQLSLRSTRADLEVSGDVALGEGYPLALSTRWQLRLPPPAADVDVDVDANPDPRQPIRLDGRGVVKGTLARLQLQQQLTGALHAELRAGLEEILSQAPRWQADLQLERAALGEWLADPTPELLALDPKGQVQAAGDLQSAQLTLALDATLPELQRTRLQLEVSASRQRVEIHRLALRPARGDTRISAKGRIDDPLGSRRIDGVLNWQGLRYPLAGMPQQAQETTQEPAQEPAQATTQEAKAPAALILSPQGQLKIEGTLDDYRLRLQTAVSGRDLPATQLTADGQGNLTGLNLESLQADTLGGRLSLDGRLRWSPRPGWNLELRAQDLQPRLHWPELPGRLGGQLHTEGELGERLNAQVRIQRLDGTLKGQPLRGQGRLALDGSSLILEQIELGWGAARLEASGAVAEQLDVQWQLQVPELGGLLANAQGKIQARGRLSGPRRLPAVDAELNLNAVQYEATRIAQLDARVAFDPAWQQPADIHLQARRIEAGGQTINEAELSIRGTEERLRIALDADSPQTARLSLRADGRLSTDLNRASPLWSWDGRVTRLDLANPQAGRWGLTGPAALALDPGHYRLERLCLAPEQTSGAACLEAQGQTGAAAPSAQARFDLDRLSLGLLAPFIPTAATLSGHLEGHGELRLAQGRLRYSAELGLPRAALSLPEEDLQLSLDNSRLTLSGDQDNAEAKLDVSLDPLQGELSGALSIRDLSGAQRLQGRLDARIEQLRPLAVLLPALQIQGGSASAGLTIGGRAAAPQLSGRLELVDGDIELPAAGIRVSRIRLQLADDPDASGRMRLEGSADSGEGRLSLQGSLVPLERQATLALTGKDFTAMNTNRIQVRVSPDLQLTLSPQRVRVRGELRIPQALIQTPKLERSAVSSSPDLVVRSDEGGAAAPGPELDIDLRVVLGESVQVDALGFNGRLVGALNLQQQGQGVARGSGSVGVASGQYRLYGQDLNISRGSLIFTGGPLGNPGLDLRVAREVDAVSVAALVGGTLRKPELNLTSSPAMPDNRILSYLLLGRAPDSASAGEQEMLMKLALSLGAKGGSSITEKLTETLNVDEIGFAAGDTAEDTSFYIGKYLSPDLYIKYGVGLVNPVNTFLMRYQLSKRLSLQSETSAQGSGGDLIYKFERD